MANNLNQSPEEIARDRIDAMLQAAGWVVQRQEEADFSVGLGVAIREYPTDTGPADYVLFVERQPVGVIEAKRPEEGTRLTAVEEQSGDYAVARLKWFKDNKPLPFIYESTGEITRFRDTRDPRPRISGDFLLSPT